MAPNLRLAELTLDLKLAIGFLTRIPVRLRTAPSAQEQTRALRLYPLIGAALGAFGGLVFAIAEGLNLGSGLAAVLTLAAIIVLTGGLHEDGWADCADAAGVPKDRARRLEVMRDSRLGSFGTIALFFSLALRAVALASLAGPVLALSALIAVHAVSRAFFPLAMALLPPARSDGLGAALAPPDRLTIGVAAGLALIIALVTLGWSSGILVFLVSLVGGLVFLGLARHAFGGYTGDVLGALQQVTEIIGLLTLVALI